MKSRMHTGNSGRNDNYICILHSKLRTIIFGKVTGNFLYQLLATSRPSFSMYTYGWRGDMREIGCNTWSIDDIVQCQLADERGGLEEERQWLLDRQSAVSKQLNIIKIQLLNLSNATRGTSDNLVLVRSFIRHPNPLL